jgi:hypothetical protein
MARIRWVRFKYCFNIYNIDSLERDLKGFYCDSKLVTKALNS